MYQVLLLKFSGFGALNLLEQAFPTGNKSALRICLLYQVLLLKFSGLNKQRHCKYNVRLV